MSGSISSNFETYQNPNGKLGNQSPPSYSSISEPSSEYNQEAVRENKIDLKKRLLSFQAQPLEEEVKTQAVIDSRRVLFGNSFSTSQKFIHDGLEEAFFDACEEANLTQIQRLVAKKADVDTKKVYSNNEVLTPLYIVAKLNDFASADFLIKNGANVRTKCKALRHRNYGNPLLIENTTALHVAAQEGDERIVQLLIENQAQCNASDGVYSRYSSEPEAQFTPIGLAAKKGKFEAVKILLSYNAEFNIDNNPPLMRAAANGHKKVMELLLENKADVEKGEYQPLLQACLSGYQDCAALLIEHKSSINRDKKDHVLCDTYSQGLRNKYETLKLLLNNGSEVDLRIESKGRQITLLMKAVIDGDLKAIKLLLEYGANVNAKSKHEWNKDKEETVLSLAKKESPISKRQAILDLLKEYGASSCECVIA